jgi:hypothetical protein
MSLRAALRRSPALAHLDRRFGGGDQNLEPRAVRVRGSIFGAL